MVTSTMEICTALSGTASGGKPNLEESGPLVAPFGELGLWFFRAEGLGHLGKRNRSTHQQPLRKQRYNTCCSGKNPYQYSSLI